MKLFVTGIGTDVGKTVVASMLCEASGAVYWKPIQAGNLENPDSEIVKKLVSRKTFCHPVPFFLKTAASPHHASALENIHINLKNIKLPKTKNSLIVEGAGGVLVPVNQKETMIDLMLHLNLP